MISRNALHYELDQVLKLGGLGMELKIDKDWQVASYYLLVPSVSSWKGKGKVHEKLILNDLNFAEMQGEQQAIEDKDAALALLYDILPVIK